MTEVLQTTTIVRCACGQVAVEAIATPISSVICYCDDCQEGARQIQALPNAASIQDEDGGTAYLVYRKDRVRSLKGASLLRSHKIRENSATNRVIATLSLIHISEPTRQAEISYA